MGTVVSKEIVDLVREAARAVLGTKGEMDKVSEEDIELIAATVEAMQLPTIDLDKDLTFINLYELLTFRRYHWLTQCSM